MIRYIYSFTALILVTLTSFGQTPSTPFKKRTSVELGLLPLVLINSATIGYVKHASPKIDHVVGLNFHYMLPSASVAVTYSFNRIFKSTPNSNWYIPNWVRVRRGNYDSEFLNFTGNDGGRAVFKHLTLSAGSGIGKCWTLWNDHRIRTEFGLGAMMVLATAYRDATSFHRIPTDFPIRGLVNISSAPAQFNAPFVPSIRVNIKYILPI